MQGGAHANGTVLLPGSIEQIIAGYALNGFTVASGVTLQVDIGGTATGTIVRRAARSPSSPAAP